MIQVPLFGGTGKGMSFASSSLEFENCYEVPTYGTRNSAAIIGAPGTALLGTGSGPCRGAIFCGGYAFFVLGQTLYRVDSSLTLTSIGTVSGSSRVSMAYTSTQIIIVTGAGGNGYIYTFSSGWLTPITDPDFPGADVVCELDGYFILVNGTNQFFMSANAAGGTYSALDFASNERSGDKTVSCIADHGEAFFFGERTVEVWMDAGEVDFPLIRNNAASIERGTCAPHSITKDDNTVFFLADDRIVYRLEGYTPVRISNDAVDNDLGQYRADVIGGAFAFVYTDHGHKFYVLTIPGYATHVYNIATQSWHKRKKNGLDYWHVNAHVFAYGKHLVGSSEDGSLLEMSREYYDDAGDYLMLRHVSNLIHMQNKRFALGKLQYFIETGVGSIAVDNAYIMVRFSKDEGNTWSTEKLLPMGRAGQYMQRCLNRCNGSARSLVIETRISAAVKRIIVDALLDVSA